MSNSFSETLKILSRRAYSEHDLRQKLIEKDFSPEEIDSAITKAADYGYINDSEYARSVARMYSDKGNYFISNKLKQSKVEREIIEEALEQIPGEKERIQPVAEKKMRTLGRYEPQKQKEKLIRYLAGRGFSSDSCIKAAEVQLKPEP